MKRLLFGIALLGASACGQPKVTQYPVWVPAAKRVLAGTGSTDIVFTGDSTVAGHLLTRDQAYPAILSGLLNLAGLPATWDSWYGGSNGEMTDSRVSMGAGWSFSSVVSIGGKTIQASSATAGPLTFTPSKTVDTFEIRYIQSPGNGSFSWAIDSGTATPISCMGTDANGVATITTTAGTHTIKLFGLGGNVYIQGIKATNSTVPSINVINVGWGGSKPADWLTNTNEPWDPVPAILALKPSLIGIGQGPNCWGYSSVSADTCTAGIQSLITAFQPYADVVLITPPASATSFASQADQQIYIDRQYQLAKANHIRVVNGFAALGTEAAGYAAGYYADPQHPSQAGNAIYGTLIRKEIWP